MTELEPTPPFRGFPWAQLVFCVACLSMTAWTWMRYSYAWDVTPEYLIASAPSIKAGGWPDRSYVRFHGKVTGKYVCPGEQVIVDGFAGHHTGGHEYDVRPLDRSSDDRHLYALMAPGPQLPAETPLQFSGRVSWTGSFALSWLDDQEILYPYLNATASRFTGASVAGIVVGAMGVFIFGLYLRRWLREREVGA